MNGYLTTTEAGQLINVSPAYIRRLAHSGRLTSKRVGQTIIVSKTSVLKYRKEADAYNKTKGKYKATETTK